MSEEKTVSLAIDWEDKSGIRRLLDLLVICGG